MRLTTADDSTRLPTSDGRRYFRRTKRGNSTRREREAVMTGHHIERLRAHRNNIRRYRRLLETSLTDLERGYIERRLLDERASVKDLLREAYPYCLSLRTTKPGADQHTTPLELTEFLHPAGAFEHPLDVLDDPDLTAYEKRAILSSWLADHCLGEDRSHLIPRHDDTSAQLEDIVDALCDLSSQTETERLDHECGPDQKDRRTGPQFPSGRRHHDDLWRTNRC